MENAMKKTPHSKLSYREMQEHLPDYAFGRISDEDKLRFEATLPDYPDLEQELADVRAVFSRVEEMDFDADISRKTRNMSVNVNNRLAKKTKRKSPIRKLVPVFMVLLASIVVLNFWGGKEPDQKQLAADNEPLYFDNNTEAIILSSLQDEEIAHTSELNVVSSTSSITDQVIVGEDEIDDLFCDMLAELDDLGSLSYSFDDVGVLFDVDYIDEISSLETSEYDVFIEELENAKIL
jgi:hypothetical protein